MTAPAPRRLPLEPDPTVPGSVPTVPEADPTVVTLAEPTSPATVLPRTEHVDTRVPLLDRLRGPVGALVRRVWRVREHHLERIPTTGPVIFAVNHVGVLDGPMAVALIPNTRAMAKNELWRHKALAPLLDALGQVPVDRWNPDPGSIRACVALLRAGQYLVIFPESHRGVGDFANFKRGTAYLAMVTGASVVPVALVGTAVGGTGVRSIPRPGEQIDVVYGCPIVVGAQEWPRTAGEVTDLTERLRAVCAQHVQQAQQECGPGTAQKDLS